MHTNKGWRRLAAPVAALGALAAVAAGGPGRAAAAAECPATVPVAELSEGMVATGYTVVQGRDPAPFAVEILGVMPDAIAPGRDMIVAELSGEAIDSVGGIWAGMSGSPVYVDDRLVGAVAYSLSGQGPSKIAGLTPADDVMALLDYPAGATPARARADRVALSDRLARRVAARTGSTAEASDTMVSLRIPLSVSGGRAIIWIRDAVEREGLPLIPYAGASASTAPAPAAEPMEPGDSFAATFSYGDVTVAEIGTATVVCDGMIVGFGHSVFPFFPQGRISMGANAARVIAIVDDPNYKLAVVEGLVGAVDQDRLAGVRAREDVLPSPVPVTSVVAAPDLGRTIEGRTDVVVADLLPTLAGVHMVDSVDSAFDQVGPGSLTATWTIVGTRADGSPWQLVRSNVFASNDDVAQRSFRQLTGNLFALRYNGFEDVTIDGVDAQVTVEEEVRRLDIVDVAVSRNGATFVGGDQTIRIAPGDDLTVRITLRPSAGGTDEDRLLDVPLRVGRRADGRGYIQVRGGGGGAGFRGCFYDPSFCQEQISRRVGSFDELLDMLESRRTNNSLSVRLRLGGRRTSFRTISKAIAMTDLVVGGSWYIPVTTGRSGPEPVRDRAPR